MGCSKDDLPSQKARRNHCWNRLLCVSWGELFCWNPPKIGSMGDVDKSFPVHAWIIKTKRPRPGQLGRVKSNQPSTWLSAENWPTWSLTSILGGEPFVKNGSTSWGNLKYPTIVGNKLEPTEGFEIKLPVARGCCRYHWTCWEILSPKKHCFKNLLLYWLEMFVFDDDGVWNYFKQTCFR